MISFPEKLKIIPGLVHGMQQSGLTGIMRIEKSTEPLQTKRLEQVFDSFLDDLQELSEQNSGQTQSIVETANKESLLAGNILDWAIRIHHQLHIVASSKTYLTPVQHEAPTYTEFEFIIPFSIPDVAATSLLNWISGLVEQTNALAADEALDKEFMDRVNSEFEEITRKLTPFAANSVNRFHIAIAAFKMDLPIRPLRSDTYCIGTGRHIRLLSSSLTDATPAISTGIAKNKAFTAELLRSAGFPAPIHALAKTEQQAIELAKKFGYPVVVKPADLDEGIGVTAGIQNADAVVAAFRAASGASKNILLEKHVEGSTHRLTVFKNQLIKVVKRIPGGVTGDGSSTIEQLIAIAQTGSRMKAISRRQGKHVLSLDEEALSLLKEQGLQVDSIPENDVEVRLRRRDNASAGGRNEAIALTDIHDDNRMLAVRAAQLLRLDFAGVDLITTDISQSWLSVGGVICEINAQPTMGVSDSPTIYQEILADLLPEGGRIPVYLAIVFSSANSDETEIKKLQSSLTCQGLSAKSGLWLGNRRIANQFKNSFAAARAILNSPDVDSALCVMYAEEIERFGLPLDRFDGLHILHSDKCSTAEQSQLQNALDLIGNQCGEICYLNTVHK